MSTPYSGGYVHPEVRPESDRENVPRPATIANSR